MSAYLLSVPPLQFTRTTSKYWVHPQDILRLKLSLLQHLPLLVYGSTDPVMAGDISSSEALKAGSHGITSLISSGEEAPGHPGAAPPARQHIVRVFRCCALLAYEGLCVPVFVCA
jgi:NAD(P)H-dependent flavin oxidoreductase YrpB (nitropropane dioxygenase family)